MQDTSTAFYKRAGALGAAAALAVSGAFIASPAIAAPTAEPDATTTDASVTTATEAPAAKPAADKNVTDKNIADETAAEESAASEAGTAEEAGTLAPGLAEALLRDLGLTVEEFEAAGELGKKAADALPKLQATEGFVGIAIEDGTIIITGSGEALEALALELDATVVAPAGEAAPETSEPAAETTEAAAEAPGVEAAEEPAAEEEKAAAVSLSADYRSNIAQIRADYIANVGVVGLQSIMWDGAGYVISVDKEAILGSSVLAKSLAEVAGSPAEAVARKYANVTVVDSSGAATPTEDVVNGQGYASPVSADEAFLCSIGFNGFNSEGQPAVITAGHCTLDDSVTETFLTDPTDDEANGSKTPSILAELGTWGFSQFGGTGNSPVDLKTGANVGTDVAVINNINSELDLLPEVTQWENAADLTAATTRITGTADAVVGAPVCKSGRTTGWSCGDVTAVGEFFVRGHKGTQEDIRGVLGFESTLTTNAKPGDSGGSTISGNNAMGINSAVGIREGAERMFSTSLTDGLTHLGGYTVAVFVDVPKLTSHENKGTVLTGAAITGNAPAGSTVNLTLNGETTDLKAAADGSWSFKAPSTVPSGGKLEFKVQAVNGFNKSKTSSYELTVEEAPLDAPVITNPANGAEIADTFQTITGTGKAGAKVTVKVSGTNTEDDAKDDTAGTLAAVEETETATVASDGTWELKLDEALTYGVYTVTAVQDGIANKAPSAQAVAEFAVILEAPAITSITDGQDFAEGSTPTEVSGTGTAGAEVALQIGDANDQPLGEPLIAVVNDNGSWTVRDLPALTAGSYKAAVLQGLSGALSDPAVVTFTVTAVEVAPQAPPVVPPAPAPTQPGDPTPAPKPDKNRDGLADTGAAGMGLFAGAGVLLTAGGISALLINRRRQTQDA